jgi:uncharacterized protein (TIGR02217 family)
VRFLDQYLPAKVAGCPWSSVPVTKTTIQLNASGKENANQEWEHPKMHFHAPEAIAREWPVVQALLTHWRIMRGPYRTWPIRDPLDFASCDLVKPNLVPTVAFNDQVIGAVDGVSDSWPLRKTYSIGPETYERPILLLVLASVIVAIDGVVIDSAGYIVSRPGGVITFASPPDPTDYADGIITAGFLFDVCVRFESDDAMEAILRAHRAAGFADLTLIEVGPC